MSNPAPLCTHVKIDGIRCGSPAVSGTDFCHHHSAIKTATSQAASAGRPGPGEFAPIPFVFPEDRASMQINYFLLLEAFNHHQIDLRTFKSLLSILKAMKANLGKTGSLIDQSNDQRAAGSDQKKGNRQQETGNSEPEESERRAANAGPIEFSPELMAEFEEIEKLDMSDPRHAARIRAAVAAGTKELKAQGLDLIEISPVAGR